jgi:GT2 family glycosyltransferase
MISVVIVSWNTAGLLADCLRSVAQAGAAVEPCEIIVVDNASRDDSAAQAAGLGARVIVNADNLGYARANNQGWQASAPEADVVVLLNSDTRVAPGALETLAAVLRADETIGACGPRLLLPDGRPQPYAFGGDPAPVYLMTRAWRRLRGRPMHDWGDDAIRDVDWVSGACLALRRDVLARIGGLDEGYFMYFEDVDLCRQVRAAGWRVRRVPQASVMHVGGQSLRQNPAARRAYGQSLRTFYRKHYGSLAQAWLTLALPFYQHLLA